MTLGISIGSRLCGSAVLNRFELIEWRTHTLRANCTERKAKVICRAIEEYIVMYDIKTVSVKIPPYRTHSAGITLLLARLLELLKHHDCTVQVHTKHAILKAVPEVRHPNELIRYVTSKYSMLIPEQTNELANKRPYHRKMFEAVLVAHITAKERYN